jgi:hypothetical protein
VCAGAVGIGLKYGFCCTSSRSGARPLM